MNAVEIEEAVSELVNAPFDLDEFPYGFLEAFGNKAITIEHLQSGASNRSDIGGVLQTSNTHIKTCSPGHVSDTIAELRKSSANARAKAKFILASDGHEVQAEELASDDVIVCGYTDFPDHFGLFLPLAGISTVKQTRESAFDIKVTGSLNRLYVELLKDNPDWGSAVRGPDMNHFTARLIFCFFAEDTDIFARSGQCTETVKTISASNSSNTHEVIGEVVLAMNEARETAGIARLASVEVVAAYELYNLNRGKLERLIHRIFAPVRLDIEVMDRFGNPVVPREWFLVPLAAIDDAVDRIRDGTSHPIPV